MHVTLPLHGIKIVSLSDIITKSVETPLLNDLDSYGLVSDYINVKSRDIKRLIYHHVIHGLCEHVLSIRGKDKILIHHCTIVPPTKQLDVYVPNSECIHFFNGLILKMAKILPIKFMICEIPFGCIKKEIKNGNGEYKEIIMHARSIIDKFDVSKYTFTKARSFSKRYGLNYLSNDYFKQIRNKQLIMG